MSAARWAAALREVGTPAPILKRWETLRTAISAHQKLLEENGIGKQVSERDRVRVNARRVGLEAPLFADEAAATFSDVLGIAMHRRAQKRNIQQHSEQGGSTLSSSPQD